MKPRFGLLLAFTVSAAFLVIGCDSTGSSAEDPPEESEDGAVSFSLFRTANSDVPSDADSAFVRIWQPDGSFNLVDMVNIPDPGQQTEVSFDVPSGQGYQTGILAVTPRYAFDQTDKELLAFGSSDKFTVVSDDTSQVAVDPRLADVTLERPESLAPNQTDTIEATYELNLPDNGSFLRASQSSISNFAFYDGTDLNSVGSSETDTTVSQRFEITGPNVDSEDTTFVKVEANFFGGNNWVTAGRRISDSYFPSSDGPSFEIPVVPGSGNDDGTVVITFSRDEDGWRKTRRAVK